MQTKDEFIEKCEAVDASLPEGAIAKRHIDIICEECGEKPHHFLPDSLTNSKYFIQQLAISQNNNELESALFKKFSKDINKTIKHLINVYEVSTTDWFAFTILNAQSLEDTMKECLIFPWVARKFMPKARQNALEQTVMALT